MTGRRWWATVRFRTTAAATVVVLITLVVGGTMLVWVVRTHLMDADLATARLRSEDVLTLADSGSLPKSLSFPDEDLGATQVVDGRGRVIASTENLEEEPPITDMRPDSGEYSSEIRRVGPLESDQRYLVVAVRSEDWDLTALTAQSMEATDDTVAALARALLIGLPLLVGIVALTTRFLIGRALRPVELITTQVADITDQDLDLRVPVPDSDDEIEELAVTMNSMLERLDAAAARQRRFVGDASHELRSPLASARTVLEVAALHPDSKESLLAAIDDALVDHDRLDHLTLSLLELARLDDHRLAIETKETDVDAVLSDLAEHRTEGSIELHTDVGTRPVSVDVVTQVMTNLLDNAARHRHASTLVTAAYSDGWTVITVDDDGPGIAPSDRARVFERFTRLDDARRADQGTGLGLAIVHELLGAIGGSIRVGDSPIGGASFVVRMPT